MNRRKFLRNGGLLGIGGMLINPLTGWAAGEEEQQKHKGKKAKNIIFLVSDGMSIGTLTMADLMMQRKLGKESRWMELYRKNACKRALMDTSSASSLITDSAAAGSAWGGGVKIPNGKINMDAEGNAFEPILQKFKAKGKAVGCVTSVPITHATPASFCVNVKHRGLQEEIAEKYLNLEFDVLMGGGTEFFDASMRKDGRDLFADFKSKGFSVAQNKAEFKKLNKGKKPVLGVYHKNGLPYMVDQNSDTELQSSIPTLAEMTDFAIQKMAKNPNGFVMQVEGGKVDWAAHANDTAAILNEQIAFDDAVGVALDFADQNEDTLVIITTDHGNSNPGLFMGKEADKHFDQFTQKAKHSNEWVLKDLNRDSSLAEIRERVEHACGVVPSYEDAQVLQKHFLEMDNDGEYNPYKLPFHELSKIQGKHSHVTWAGITHSADFVELAMYGAGSSELQAFMKNTDLHNYMLDNCL